MKRSALSSLFLLIVLVFALSGCGTLFAGGPGVQPVLQAGQPAIIESAPPADPAVQESPVLVPPVQEPITQPETQQPVPSTNDLFAQQEELVSLYERVNPGVVYVGLSQGSGSGFVIDSAGYIVTNNHVVAAGGPVQVMFHDGRVKDATIVGTDPDSDLAILKVDAQPGELTALPLGDSEAVRVGEIVVAIGSPFGLQNTMTTGIISGLSRAMPGGRNFNGPTYQIPDVIQTDAAINPGNSGGPLINLNGEVIGVNTAIESPVRANSGVGFAVPSNVVKVVSQQIIATGEVAHPYLGISGGTLTQSTAEALGLDPNTRGVLVSAVTSGGPAAGAGLRGGDPQTGLGGDIITAVDGRAVNEFDDLIGYVIQHTVVGQTIQLTVLRNGQTVTVPLVLGERPTAG